MNNEMNIEMKQEKTNEVSPQTPIIIYKQTIIAN